MSHPWAAGSEMLSNAEFVKKELPGLFLSDDLRAEVLKLCESWMSTYFDLIDDTLSHGLADRWVRDDIASAHKVVQLLDVAAQAEPRYGSVYILVAESATNVLNAFGGGAAEAVREPSRSPQVSTAPQGGKQSTGDFWREQYAKGMTHEQFVEVMNSLPPIVPMSSQALPTSRPADKDRSSGDV